MSLTFCIASYGQARFLLETLESIRNQTLRCRAVVCFGGQPPESVRAYAATQDWLDLLAVDPDPGMVACWQAAADRATTEFLAFLADDNTLEPTFAAVLVDCLIAHPGIDFAFCNQQHLRPDGEIDAAATESLQRYFGRDRLAQGPIAVERFAELISRKSSPLEASLFRRNTWLAHRPFYPAAKGAFDIEFLFRLLILGRRPYFVPQALMNFRWHGDAYSGRARHEHLRGGVATYTHLETVATGELKSALRGARLAAETRLLRFPLPPAERLALSWRLVCDGRLLGVAKQNLARLLGKPA
jgi:glycosyltransferase involved in cell wall biosynthesis